MKKSKGFTIIELIVVIAIIAILAVIVIANISGYSAKAKVSKANAEATNIGKAMLLYYATYGDFPDHNGAYSWICRADWGCNGEDGCDGSGHCLSEFLRMNYGANNANYFTNNGFYIISAWSSSGSVSAAKFDCGTVEIWDSIGGYYGGKYFMGGDASCGVGNPNFTGNIQKPFQIKSYN